MSGGNFVFCGENFLKKVFPAPLSKKFIKGTVDVWERLWAYGKILSIEMGLLSLFRHSTNVNFVKNINLQKGLAKWEKICYNR